MYVNVQNRLIDIRQDFCDRGNDGRFISLLYIESELLLSLYWGNELSLSEIGNIFGCSHGCILKKMKYFNIPRRELSQSNRISSNQGKFGKGNIPWNNPLDGKRNMNLIEMNYKQKRDLTRDKQRKWAYNIFKRDNYTCQICGNRGKLNAHHIKSWKNFPDLRFDINNGISVCEICHYKVHKNVLFNNHR
jgi:hypothetical protein